MNNDLLHTFLKFCFVKLFHLKDIRTDPCKVGFVVIDSMFFDHRFFFSFSGATPRYMLSIINSSQIIIATATTLYHIRKTSSAVNPITSAVSKISPLFYSPIFEMKDQTLIA